LAAENHKFGICSQNNFIGDPKHRITVSTNMLKEYEKLTA